MKTKLCIGCAKGFEILSSQTGTKESILDEADPSLDFATQRESVTPLAIHRLGRDFLLCYSEFVFLINRNGWRTNHDWGYFGKVIHKMLRFSSLTCYHLNLDLLKLEICIQLIY